MRPVELTAALTMPIPASTIAHGILELERWNEWEGYGPIPGIAAAEWARRTDDVTGSRIRVTNRDGSTHEEEIVHWVPDERVVLRMDTFSKPLALLADHFIEDWRFSARDGRTRVTRTFTLHGRNRAGQAALRLVAPFLRLAARRHLEHLASSSPVVDAG